MLFSCEKISDGVRCCRRLNLASLADRRLSLCCTLFKKVTANEYHILQYLLPAKCDTELSAVCDRLKYFQSLYALEEAVINIHLFDTDWTFSVPVVVLTSSVCCVCIAGLNSASWLPYSNKGYYCC